MKRMEHHSLKPAALDKPYGLGSSRLDGSKSQASHSALSVLFCCVKIGVKWTCVS